MKHVSPDSQRYAVFCLLAALALSALGTNSARASPLKLVGKFITEAGAPTSKTNALSLATSLGQIAGKSGVSCNCATILLREVLTPGTAPNGIHHHLGKSYCHWWIVPMAVVPGKQVLDAALTAPGMNYQVFRDDVLEHFKTRCTQWKYVYALYEWLLGGIMTKSGSADVAVLFASAMVDNALLISDVDNNGRSDIIVANRDSVRVRLATNGDTGFFPQQP